MDKIKALTKIQKVFLASVLGMIAAHVINYIVGPYWIGLYIAIAFMAVAFVSGTVMLLKRTGKGRKKQPEKDTVIDAAEVTKEEN